MRYIRRNLLPLALVLIACAPPPTGAAGATKEAEYHAVVKLIESYYRVKHRGVPFVANMGMKAAKVISSDVRRAMRFGDFKLAIFEDQDFNARDGFTEFHRQLRQTLQPGWDALVAVRARDEGLTYTFTKPAGDRYKVLIVVIGQRDGTVLQVDLNMEEFVKLLQDPERESRNITDEVTSHTEEDPN